MTNVSRIPAPGKQSRSALSPEGRTHRLIETLTWRHQQEADELAVVEALVTTHRVLIASDLARLEARRHQSAAALVACPFVSWGDAGEELAKECLKARDLSARFNELRAGAVAANDQGGMRPGTAEEAERLIEAFSAACAAGRWAVIGENRGPTAAADPTYDLTGLRSALASRATSHKSMSPLDFVLYAESPESGPEGMLDDMLRDIEAATVMVKALIRSDDVEFEAIDTILWMVMRKIRAAQSLAAALTNRATTGGAR